MPTDIARADVERLVRDGAQLVEVLSRDDYAEAHLPGALSIPLDELDRATTADLERDRPVIVYCHDTI